MKASQPFQETISNYLESRGKSDSLFAETLKKSSKTIDECIAYIFQQVLASGCNGFADEEIYNMAVHYYDEDDIKVDKKAVNGKVIVNHSVLAPKAKAIKTAEPTPTVSKPAAPKKAKPVIANQPSLF